MLRYLSPSYLPLTVFDCIPQIPFRKMTLEETLVTGIFVKIIIVAFAPKAVCCCYHAQHNECFHDTVHTIFHFIHQSFLICLAVYNKEDPFLSPASDSVALQTHWSNDTDVGRLLISQHMDSLRHPFFALELCVIIHTDKIFGSFFQSVLHECVQG